VAVEVREVDAETVFVDATVAVAEVVTEDVPVVV
jgi:hypothetical protein